MLLILVAWATSGSAKNGATRARSRLLSSALAADWTHEHNRVDAAERSAAKHARLISPVAPRVDPDPPRFPPHAASAKIHVIAMIARIILTFVCLPVVRSEWSYCLAYYAGSRGVAKPPTDASLPAPMRHTDFDCQTPTFAPYPTS